MKVLFRVNAGPQIGLGHLKRSLSLSKALEMVGVQSYFLINRSEGTHPILEQAGVDQRVRFLETAAWSDEDLKRTLDVAAAASCAGILVDSNDVTPRYLDGLKAAGWFVIVRDESANKVFSCSLVVNGDGHAKELPYRSLNRSTRFLLGPEYAVLPEAFRDLPQRGVSPSVRNLLVLLGSADPQGLMPSLLRHLDACEGDFLITAVVGPYFQNRDQVDASAGRIRHPVRLLYHPSSLFPSMWEADLAISGGGQTLYELAAVGCPTLAIQNASDQGKQLRALEQAGCLQIVAQAWQPDAASRTAKALSQLLANPDGRTAMVRAGQQLVDGQGAFRLAQEIERELSGVKKVSQVLR